MPNITPDNLTLIARFRDGSTVNEPTLLSMGGFRGALERGLESFTVQTHDGSPIATVVVRDDMRPIFGRLMVVSATGQRLRAVVYGWQKTVNGSNVKALTWITSDGEMIVADRDLDEIEASR